MPQTRSDTLAIDEPVSSPARPSHHKRVNPYAKASAQVKRNLKRSATAAALPSPPATTRKRKHLDTPHESDDDVLKTPTKPARTLRTTATLQTPDVATPKALPALRRGRSAAHTDASPGKVLYSVRERSRSPTPFDSGKQASTPSLLNRLSGAARQLAEDDQNEMNLTPRKRQRRTAVATPSTPRQTRSTTRTIAVRDSPNNPFVASTKVIRKPAPAISQVALHKRESIRMV